MSTRPFVQFRGIGADLSRDSGPGCGSFLPLQLAPGPVWRNPWGRVWSPHTLVPASSARLVSLIPSLETLCLLEKPP